MKDHVEIDGTYFLDLCRKRDQLYLDGHADQSIAPAKEICKYIESIVGKNNTSYAMELSKLGRIYNTICKDEEAEDSLSEALDIVRKIKSSDATRKIHAIIFMELELLYHRKGDAAKSHYYREKMIENGLLVNFDGSFEEI